MKSQLHKKTGRCLMTLRCRRLPALLLCFVQFGALSGCIGSLADPTIIFQDLANEKYRASPEYYRTGKNHYKPVILTSNENMIKVKYLNVGPYAQHEQVIQLIFDHCDGAYTELNRVELRGYTTIEAECTGGY